MGFDSVRAKSFGLTSLSFVQRQRQSMLAREELLSAAAVRNKSRFDEALVNPALLHEFVSSGVGSKHVQALPPDHFHHSGSDGQSFNRVFGFIKFGEMFFGEGLCRLTGVEFAWFDYTGRRGWLGPELFAARMWARACKGFASLTSDEQRCLEDLEGNLDVQLEMVDLPPKFRRCFLPSCGSGLRGFAWFLKPGCVPQRDLWLRLVADPATNVWALREAVAAERSLIGSEWCDGKWHVSVGVFLEAARSHLDWFGLKSKERKDVLEYLQLLERKSERVLQAQCQSITLNGLAMRGVNYNPTEAACLWTAQRLVLKMFSKILRIWAGRGHRDWMALTVADGLTATFNTDQECPGDFDLEVEDPADRRVARDALSFCVKRGLIEENLEEDVLEGFEKTGI